MKVTASDVPDVLVLEPAVWKDARGTFQETFNHRAFAQILGTETAFVQDNLSHSVRGVLRGLHYQLAPHAQGKLVCVLQGEIWDVAVDLRMTSPSFGKWVGHRLTANAHQQLWIPPGFAHGFVVLSESADVFYKTTAYYAPQSDRGIAWNDPDLAIQWPDLGMDFVLSDKDQRQSAFRDADVF